MAAFVLFTVLTTYPHEIILGWNIPASHSALIECARGEIELDTADSHYNSHSVVSKLCCLDTASIRNVAR